MSARREVPIRDVRRLFIHKQHLDGGPRPRAEQLFHDLGCIQLDPIQAVDKSHRLVLWSRLGTYDPAEIASIRWQKRTVFEYWAHAASLVPTETWPLHHYRMRLLRDGNGRWAKRQAAWFDSDPDVIFPLRDHILQRLGAEKGLRSRDFVSKAGKQPSRWSSNRYVTRLLDYLWSIGEITVVGREKLDRIWGLTADFLPEWTPQETWSALDVTRFAAQKSLQTLGIATQKDILNNFTRGLYPHLSQVLGELLSEELVDEVTVIGENNEPLCGPWYLHRDDLPALDRLQQGGWQPRTTLLSPFDNLICSRSRLEVLFDFFYRVEIYVPRDKREYGYYVLPILYGDRLIGRINPKMDRSTETLHIHHVYVEPGVNRDDQMLKAVRSAIHQLAEFLGAVRISWGILPWGWARLKY